MLKYIELIKELLKKDRYVLLFFILISFSVFSPSFLNLNFFWDDERFVFLNPALLQSPGFLNFWNPKSVFFKTWPLGYSIFWGLVKYSPLQSLVFYKIINIVIHGLNSFLVFKFLKKLHFKYTLVPSLFFLVHPLHVETVSWIFQLLTLVAFSFFTLALHFFTEHLETKKMHYYLFSVLFFSFSIWTKSIAILSPFIFLFLIWFYRKSLSLYLIVAPFFIISVLTGVINIKGVESFSPATQHQSQFKKMLFNTIDSSINSISPEDKNVIANDNANMYFQSIYGNYTKPSSRNFSSSDIFKNGVWHYFSKTIAPINLSFIYPQLEINSLKVVVPLIFIIAIPIFLGIRTSNRSLFFIPVFSFFLLLPYLGLTYITFFYWSPVSDRYTYFSMIVLAFCIAFLLKFFEKKSYPSVILLLFSLSSLSFFHGQKFNQPEKMYEEILQYKSHPVIYSVLFERYLLKLDTENAGRVIYDGIKKFPNNPNLQADVMRFEALKKSLKSTELP